jgi:KUP system potassium uptake protein
MTLGSGSAISKSTKQKINTRSSTIAELVGVNDAMSMILWTRLFLEAQGIKVTDNVIYQDNQSTMLLAKNGRQSSGKNTRHLEIRYYFVTDNIGRKRVSIEYCPTQDMLADFFTKPLQGALFYKLRKLIMGLPDDVPLASDPGETKKEISFVNAQECVGPSGSSTRIIARDGAFNQRRSYADVVRTEGSTGATDCRATRGKR